MRPPQQRRNNVNEREERQERQRQERRQAVRLRHRQPDIAAAIEERALTSGGYPYDEEMKKKVFKEELLQLQLELLKLQTHIQDDGRALRRTLRGPRRLRQRELHQPLPRAPQSAPRALRRAVEADRGRARPMVLPALRRAPADGRRHGPLRPLLVQPRRRRARHGLLHAGADGDVPARCARLRGAAGARRHPPVQVLSVIGREMQLMRFHERRHDPFKRWKITDIDLAAIDKWDDYTRARPKSSPAPTPTPRRGSSCAPTTSAARGWRRSAGCCRGSTTPTRTVPSGHARSQDHRHRPQVLCYRLGRETPPRHSDSRISIQFESKDRGARESGGAYCWGND